MIDVADGKRKAKEQITHLFLQRVNEAIVKEYPLKKQCSYHIHRFYDTLRITLEAILISKLLAESQTAFITSTSIEH